MKQAQPITQTRICPPPVIRAVRLVARASFGEAPKSRLFQRSLCLRMMSSHPFAQGIIHAGLPALTASLEALDDVSVVSHGDSNFRIGESGSPAAPLHLRELFIGR